MEWHWQKDAADMYHALMEAVSLSGDAVKVCTLKCCVCSSRVGCHVPTGWLCIPERRERTHTDCQESGELQWAGGRNRETGCISSRCIMLLFRRPDLVDACSNV